MASHPKLEALFEQAKKLQPIPAAIISPTSTVALAGALLAAEQGSIEPILLGDATGIRNTAAQLGKDITKYQLLDIPVAEAAVKQAIELVHNDAVKLIMKGSLHSDEFMRMIVRRESNMRTGIRMSHCMVYDVPAYHKLLIITDAALNTIPSLAEKKDIVQNAINLAIKLGIATPKVALLSAVENINIRIPNTTECAELCQMAANHAITGGIVEGPLSFDLAISADSVATKKLVSQVGGDADILVVPNIEAGNILMKALDYFADALGLGIVLGAKVPIVLTSRSASAASRAGSCLLAKFINS